MNGDGGCNTSQFVSQDEFNHMVNQGTTMVDEASGQAIPADIPTSDASEGTSLWDRLSSAGGDLANSALDWLQRDIGEISWSSAPEFALVVGAGLAGWHIGSWFANLLGISGGGGTGNQPATGLVPIDAGTEYVARANPPLSNVATAYPDASPEPGYVVDFGGHLYTINYPACSGGSSPPTYSGIPSGATPVLIATDPHGATCSGLYTTVTFTAYYVRRQVTALPGPGQGDVTTPSNLCENAAGCTASNQSIPNMPSEALTKSRVASSLTQPGEAGVETAVWTYVCTQPDSACTGAVPTGNGTIQLPAITPNETYQEWVAAARAAGLVGTITKYVLSDLAADPSVAPNDVVSTAPQAGTNVASSTSVQVQVNPSDATGTSGGPPVGPTLPGLAVPSAPTPCNVFPFGVPCWLVNQLERFNAAPVAPHFSITAPKPLGGAAMNVSVGSVFGVDTSVVMDVVRPILLVMAVIAITLWLAGKTGGFGGGGAAAEGD